MNLLDGLNRYKADANWWNLTEKIERSSAHVLELISLHAGEPGRMAVDAAYAWLLSIEGWKAMCLNERMGNAGQNSPQLVWDAFRGTVCAQDDLKAILSIMRLKGFGASQDEETGQRRAKVATAVLRFLRPSDWGVVDWRTIAVLSCLDRNGGTVDKTLAVASSESAHELRSLFDIVDEKMACEVNRKYRAMRTGAPLSRAADIDMALFGLSLMAWPM